MRLLHNFMYCCIISAVEGDIRNAGSIIHDKQRFVQCAWVPFLMEITSGDPATAQPLRVWIRNDHRGFMTSAFANLLRCSPAAAKRGPKSINMALVAPSREYLGRVFLCPETNGDVIDAPVCGPVPNDICLRRIIKK